MPDTVLPLPQPTLLPIAGRTERFPVRRVYCIGRNYAAHAREMGHDPDREPPFFFQKNPDNLNPTGIFDYPSETADVHHEIEMLVALQSGGTNIPEAAALEAVFGYGVALDMTRRDLQAEAKKAGRPWEIGKAGEGAAPVGPLLPADAVGHPDHGAITLAVNGEVRQSGDLNQMIWKVPEMISYLSEYFELAAGDVIMAGTPSGVNAVEPGDTMEASIESVGILSVKVV